MNKNAIKKARDKIKETAQSYEEKSEQETNIHVATSLLAKANGLRLALLILDNALITDQSTENEIKRYAANLSNIITAIEKN